MTSDLKQSQKRSTREWKNKIKNSRNIYFAKIITFVKNNIALTKQVFFLSNFVDYLHKISYEIHEIYYEIVNAQMNTQFNWNNLQVSNDWRKFKKNHQTTFNLYQNIVVDIAKFITEIKNNNLLFISNLSFEVDDEYVKKINDCFENIV